MGMGQDRIRCSRCMKDWVRPVGLAYRDGEPAELFECAACGKQVEFTVEPQAPPVRRIGGTMQPPMRQADPLEAI